MIALFVCMYTVLVNFIVASPAAVPVVNILFNNLEDFLPPSLLKTSNEEQGGSSIIYSIQIGERPILKASQVLEETPISLNFTFSEVLHILDNYNSYVQYWPERITIIIINTINYFIQYLS